MGNFIFNKKKKKGLADLSNLPSINKPAMKKIIGGKKKNSSSGCGGIIPQ